MKKLIRIILAGFLLLSGCESSIPPVAANEYDPEASFFIGSPVIGTQVETITKKSAKLFWIDNSPSEIRYFIQKENLKTHKISTITTQPNDCFFIDNDLDIYTDYKYLIGNKTNTNYFVYSDTVYIKYNPYIVDSITLTADNAKMSRNGSRIVSYTGGILKVYDGRFNLIKNTSPVRISVDYKISDDGRFVAYFSNDELGCFDLENNKNLFLINSTQGEFRDVNISPDNKYLCASKNNSVIEIWDIENKTSRSVNTSQYLKNLKFSPQKRFIAASDGDATYIWSFDSFELYAKLPRSSNFCFSDDENTFAYFDDSKSSITFFNLVNKYPVINIESGLYTNGLTFIDNDESFIFWSQKKIVTYSIKKAPVFTPQFEYNFIAEKGAGVMQTDKDGNGIIPDQKKYIKYVKKAPWERYWPVIIN